MKFAILIPTYNESTSIPELVDSLAQLRQTGEYDFDVLVIDDNSPDGTAEIAQAMGYEWVRLLKRPGKDGLGNAYRAGFVDILAQPQYDQIVTMDADGSHQARDLSSLLKAASSADLVIGSRWVAGGQVRNWPTIRKMISRVGNSYAKFMLGTKIQDMTSGFRVFRAQFLQELVAEPVSSHGYSFQVEIAFRASQKGVVMERPITFVERINGKSKMTLAIVFEALTKVTLWGLRRVFS